MKKHRLSVRNLASRRFGLDRVSFDVAAGEFLTMLEVSGLGVSGLGVSGRGGTGKTAVLSLVAGLAEPDTGLVEIDGLPAATDAHRRGIGVVFAAENLFRHLTVADNLALPLRVRKLGAGERQNRIDAMLDLLRLRDVAGQRPGALTPPDAARAALARALVIEPRLLLLDEPFTGCDPDSRAVLGRDLRRLQAELGFAVVMATSVASDARAVSDRIAVLLDGRIVQDGPVAELYDRPVNAAVAACLGEVNRLPGVIRAVDDDIVQVALDCGPLVDAMPADIRLVGARCVVLVRPERVAVAVVSAAELGEGAVPARLEQVVDMGDHIRLHLTAGDAPVTVRRPGGAAMAGFSQGRVIAIAWQPQNAWACRPDQ